MATKKESEWKREDSYAYSSPSKAQAELEKDKAYWDDSSKNDAKHALDMVMFDISDQLRKMDTDIYRKYGRDSVQYGVVFSDNDAIDQKVYEYLNYEASFWACDNGVRKIPSFHSLESVAPKPAFGGQYQFSYSYPVYSFKIFENKASHREERGTGQYTASYSSISDKVTIKEETQTVRVDDSTWTLIKNVKTVTVTISFRIYAFQKGKLEELETMINAFNNSQESKTYSDYSKLEKGGMSSKTAEIKKKEKQIALNNEEIRKTKKGFETAKWHCKDVRLPLVLWIIINIAIVAFFAWSMSVNAKFADIPFFVYLLFFGGCIVSVILGYIYYSKTWDSSFEVDGHPHVLVSEMPIFMHTIPISAGGSIIITALIGFIYNNALALLTPRMTMCMRNTIIPLFIIAIICLIVCFISYTPRTSRRKAEKLIADREKVLNSQSAHATTQIEELTVQASAVQKAFEDAKKSGEWEATKRKVRDIAEFYAAIRY